MKTVFLLVSVFGFLGCASPTSTCKCAQAPVLVSHAQLGEPCGGYSNIACGDDAFCEYTSEQITFDDASGTCKARPTECSDPVQVPGVCAYDGIRYINECNANKMGHDVFPSTGPNACD
jgi:hypothetical protein